jgi:hypothetical protein
VPADRAAPAAAIAAARGALVVAGPRGVQQLSVQ